MCWRGSRPPPRRATTAGRPKVIDDDMLTFAAALRDKGVAMPEIAGKLTIKSGKNAGKNPSVASLYGRSPTPPKAATASGKLSVSGPFRPASPALAAAPTPN